MVTEKEKHYLMIKSIIDISEGEEILTHYADQYEAMLRKVAGCKCMECINRKPINNNKKL